MAPRKARPGANKRSAQGRNALRDAQQTWAGAALATPEEVAEVDDIDLEGPSDEALQPHYSAPHSSEDVRVQDGVDYPISHFVPDAPDNGYPGDGHFDTDLDLTGSPPKFSEHLYAAAAKVADFESNWAESEATACADSSLADAETLAEEALERHRLQFAQGEQIWKEDNESEAVIHSSSPCSSISSRSDDRHSLHSKEVYFSGVGEWMSDDAAARV